MLKKFKGRLRSKVRKSLIKENDKNELDDLFLTLALIYNDLKDIIFFQDSLNKTYEPIKPVIDPHTGEFGGLNIHIVRILSGMINEFLELLKDSKIVESKEFSDMLDKLKPPVRQLWKDLIAISRKKKVQDNPTNYALMMIRGNIGFHYIHAGKNLRSGYINRFLKKKPSKALKNDAAYFSLENTMEETRFYYADASAEEYMMMVSNNWNNYLKDVNDLVRAINFAIYFLMIDYLKAKK